MITSDLVLARLAGSIEAIDSLRDHSETIAVIADLIVERLAAGATIFTCGNGGSAAEAMHFSEELIGRYRGDRAPQRAVCLNADPAALTCIANDFGFDRVFARQCEALIREGDVLLVFSTSGNSPNIVEALLAASELGATTIGLLGRGGGAAADFCNHAVTLACDDSAHIQEAHQVVLHILCEFVEQRCR
jgi:D-sedoheptulose 7-phosphate isomerase